MPILARQIAPGRPGPGPPEHSVEDQPVVHPAATSTRTPVGQQRLQPGPFLVGQIVAIKHEEDLPHPLTVIHGTRRRSRVATITGSALPEAATAPLPATLTAFTQLWLTTQL